MRTRTPARTKIKPTLKPDNQGKRTFTCVRCKKSFSTTQTHVRQWTIDKWWAMVANLCANCRVEQQGEPAQGAYHSQGGDTEREAAASMRPFTGTMRKEVIRLLADAPNGLTDDEGGALMKGDRLTFGRRRNELVRAGLVRDSGQRRLTPAGRKAIVWVSV